MINERHVYVGWKYNLSRFVLNATILPQVFSNTFHRMNRHIVHRRRIHCPMRDILTCHDIGIVHSCRFVHLKYSYQCLNPDTYHNQLHRLDHYTDKHHRIGTLCWCIWKFIHLYRNRSITHRGSVPPHSISLSVQFDTQVCPSTCSRNPSAHAHLLVIRVRLSTLASRHNWSHVELSHGFGAEKSNRYHPTSNHHHTFRLHHCRVKDTNSIW
jgi:hypothetical protein